jgi:hypothetical protein
VNEDFFEEEDGFQTPPSLPQPSTSTTAMGTRRSSRPGSRSTSRGPSPGYDLANVRPDLRMARFHETSWMQDLNTDEQAFFQKTFYGNINPKLPVLQEQGCPYRSNPEGLIMCLQPKKK